MDFRKFLIAVDDSPLADHAADVGLDLARALGAEAALIHSVPLPLSFPNGGIVTAESMLTTEEEGKQLLAGYCWRKRLPASTMTFVPAGEPAPQIVKVAREWTADVVVIGSHGREGMQRVLLGSIAEAVMRHAPCPVLVVRSETAAGPSEK